MLKKHMRGSNFLGEHSLAKVDCIPNTESRQGDFEDTTNETVFY